MKINLKENKKVYFDDITHTYRIKDKFLKGVTTLLKERGKAPNYDYVAPEKLEKSACFGTAVHQTLQAFDEGRDIENPKSIVGANRVYNFDVSRELLAYQSLHIPVIANEYLVSDNEVIASCIDKVAITDKEDEVKLIDIKTTSVIQKNYISWQLSIYAYLFELQNPKIKVGSLEVIHIRGDEIKVEEVKRISTEEVKKLIYGESLFENGVDYKLEDVISSDGSILLEKERSIYELEERLKVLKSEVEEYRQAIYNFMGEKGLTKLALEDNCYYSYRSSSVRESIDTKLLKSELPEVYSKYVKSTECKGGVSFKMKEKTE